MARGGRQHARSTARPAALSTAHLESSAAFEMRVGGKPRSRSPSRCRRFSAAIGAMLLLAYPEARRLPSARKLQVALGAIDPARPGARRVRHLARGRPDHASRWRGSTKPPGGWRRASMSRSRCAARTSSRGSLRASTRWSAKIDEREQRITQLAFNDVLTGLPNRTMFQQQLDHLLRAPSDGSRCSRCTASTSTSSRSINDTLGHPAGDALLIAGRRSACASRARAISSPGSAATSSSSLQTVERRPRRDRPARRSDCSRRSHGRSHRRP